MRPVAALVAVTLLMACGSSSAASTAKANVVTGAASCPADQRQDLVFSGYLTGHLTCSRAPALCVPAAGNLTGSLGLSALVAASVSGAPVQIVIAFAIDPVVAGSYTAGSIGDEQTSSPTGITLDGIGHWQTRASDGTMTIGTFDASSAAGWVNARLEGGAHQSFTLRGAWRCVRTPAA
jgi:hypothetical protein